jgi:hypothetical protein
VLVELCFAAVIVVLFGLQVRRMIRHPDDLGLVDVAILASCLVWGGSPILAAVTSPQLWDRTEIAQGIWPAYGCVLLYLAALEVSRGRRKDGVPRPMKVVFDSLSEAVPMSLVAFCAAAAWGVRLVMATGYGILLSGTASLDRNLSVPYPVAAANFLSISLMYGVLCFCAVRVVRENSRLPWVLIGMEAIWQFLQGRRFLLSVILVVAIGFITVRRRFTLRHIVLAASFAAAFVVAAVLFNNLRLIYFSGATGDAVLDLRMAVAGLVNADAGEVWEQGQSDVGYRALGTRKHISDLIAAQDRASPMWGEVFWISTLQTVPRVLLPSKLDQDSPELAMILHYGLPLTDASTTLASWGVADLGYFGAFIMGLVFGYSLRLAELVAVRFGRISPLVAFVWIGSYLWISTQVESDPTPFIGIARDATLVTLALLTVARLGSLHQSLAARKW